MVNVNDAFEVKLKKKGENFEILVDFDKYEEYKKNPATVELDDILADDKIFKDQRKGEVASENQIKQIFENKSHDDVIKEILNYGECQIPSEYLKKLREEKKTQIINYITQNAVNPQTNTKYTLGLIQREVDSLKFNFDYRSSTNVQAEKVLDLLKVKMPIKIEFVTMEISIPAEYVGKFYGKFRTLGKVEKEYYDKNASLNFLFTLNASLVNEVSDYIDANTNNTGSYYIKK